MSKLNFLIAIFSFSGTALFGQEMLGPIPTTPETGVLDGVYVEENVPTKKVIPYEHLREADAIWSKRVWRVLDLREKINLPLYYPLETSVSVFDPNSGQETFETYSNNRQWSLWRIIRHHAFDKIIAGQAPDITTYYSCAYGDCGTFPEDGDQFKYPILPPAGDYSDSNFIQTIAPLFNKVVRGETYEVKDENGFLIYDENDQPLTKTDPDKYIPITSDQIVQYHIKEDWFFDKERSVMDQRILGIAPVVYEVEGDQVKGYKRLFWIYFPECRYVFQNYFVFNRKNDSQRMSYDDVFWKRQFSSYVYKESNVHDRSIDTYKVGVDALLESERIKEDIFKIEHDVWHF